MPKSSWKLTNNKLIKSLDNSSFNYRTSVVPAIYLEFFEMSSQDQDIFLEFEERFYEASLKWTRPDKPIVRLKWEERFNQILKKYFPEWDQLKTHSISSNLLIEFSKVKKTDYKVRLMRSNSSEFEKFLDRSLDNDAKTIFLSSKDEFIIKTLVLVMISDLEPHQKEYQKIFELAQKNFAEELELSKLHEIIDEVNRDVYSNNGIDSTLEKYLKMVKKSNLKGLVKMCDSVMWADDKERLEELQVIAKIKELL